jgi:CubicO group peptidase (beta-lactamase class C family)
MSEPAEVDAARALLQRAVEDRTFPAAVAEVGDSERVLWREAFGRLTFDAGAPPAREAAIFDLASLTKPLATATLVVHLAASGRIDLEQPLSECFDEWRGIDREAATVRDLLEHASGLAARLVDPPPAGRREFEHEICGMRLEYEARSKSVYSDLGFILLGFLAADRGAASLDALFARLSDHLRQAVSAATTSETVEAFLGFEVPAALRGQTAPTRALDEDRRRGQRLTATVHDNYAAALSGVAGHAGLFGNTAGVAVFARALLSAAREGPPLFPPFTYPWVMTMARRSTVPGSSRALGWDTMLPTSSCGAGMSFAAFGHVGYTGTSLWIDPILDRYFILLTNRVCDGGSVEDMQQLRRAFHDALVTID